MRFPWPLLLLGLVSLALWGNWPNEALGSTAMVL